MEATEVGGLRLRQGLALALADLSPEVLTGLSV
jgi:hypothetical protein